MYCWEMIPNTTLFYTNASLKLFRKISGWFTSGRQGKRKKRKWFPFFGIWKVWVQQPAILKRAMRPFSILKKLELYKKRGDAISSFFIIGNLFPEIPFGCKKYRLFLWVRAFFCGKDHLLKDRDYRVPSREIHHKLDLDRNRD